MYEYFDEMENGSFLEHHGILGQKWGIRRFQNYDGTLKAAGKRRAKTDRDKERAERKAARAEKKEAKAQAKAEKAKADLEAAKKRAIANADLNEIMKLRGSMTSEELKDAAARAGYLSSISTKMPKKQSMIDRVASGAKTIQGITENIQKAQASISAIRKEMGLDVKSILNDSDDSGGNKADSDGPDIIDRALKLAGNITKDAANKASEKYQQRKYDKQLKEASDRIKDNEALDWLKSVSGTKREENASDEEKQRKLQASVSGHGKVDQGFKLKDGDYSVFSSAARDTKVSDIPKPRPIKLPKAAADKPLSEVYKESDDLQEKLRKGNASKLGL